MKNRLTLATMTLACAAGIASAQSASVSLSSSSPTVSPGGTVTITVSSDYDLAGAGAGVFGAAGFYGFGGDINISGSSAPDATASNAAVDAALSWASTTDLGTFSFVQAAGGRGLAGGLAANPAELATFDITIDAGAASGDFTLDYSGSVVLVMDDTLTTFSTSPGLNQMSLTTTPLTITVSAGCSPADVTTTGAGVGDPGYGVPDGAITTTDIQYYVNFWVAGDVGVADLTTTGAGVGDPGYGVPDGAVTTTDIQYYVNLWVAGCP